MRTLKYAWRFLMRSKSYTIINLLGLAFSLACSIILIRYIHRELTVDAHSVDPEHIIIPLRDMEGNIHPGSLQQDCTEADSVYILDHQIVEQCRLMLQQRDNVVYEVMPANHLLTAKCCANSIMLRFICISQEAIPPSC